MTSSTTTHGKHDKPGTDLSGAVFPDFPGEQIFSSAVGHLPCQPVWVPRRCGVVQYKAYCDRHGIPLWMDNASTPQHFMPDGSPIIDYADMVGISLHETKTIGRGQCGLLLVPLEPKSVARRATNFGCDVSFRVGWSEAMSVCDVMGLIDEQPCSWAWVECCARK